MNHLQRKLGAVLCAMMVALSVLGIAPKAAYAVGENYTVALSHDGGITKQTLIGDYELGTDINLITGGISDRLGDILNSYTKLLHVGNTHFIMPEGNPPSSFYTDNADRWMSGTICAFHSEGEMGCSFNTSLNGGVGRFLVTDVRIYVMLNKSTIRFDANGGDGTMEPQVVSSNVYTDLKPNEFTRENARFLGWNTNADGSGTSYADCAEMRTSSDMTLYAQWELNHEVKVADNGHGSASANAGGGNVGKTIRAYAGERISLSVDSVASGHALDEWQVASGDIELVDDQFVMGGDDVEIKAIFEPHGYTIAYDANGGEGQADDIRVLYDEETTVAPCAFTRTGYSFAGWQDRDGNPYEDGAKVKNLTDVHGNTVTLLAQWKPNAYTVHYEAGYDGCADTMADQTFSYDEEKPLTANAFRREGYKFVGWKGSDGKDYADGQSVKNLTATNGETITMTAQWEAIMYTVTFMANGGTGAMEPQEIQALVPTPLKRNEFTRENARFVGWNTMADGTGTRVADGVKVKLTSDLTLYAQWELSHTIKVTDNGHGTASANKSRAYAGETISLSVDSVEDGYVFDEWQVVYGGVTVSGDSFVMGDSDVEIKAVFLPVGYTLAYDPNGCDGQMDDVRLAFDEETTLGPCTFTREGYTITGWEDRDGKSYEDEQAVSRLTDVDGATVTMKAQARPNAYTVVYDANGGAGEMSDQAFTYDEEQALSANAFTREGYTFAGWQGSDGNSYTDGQVVKNLTATDEGVVTLSAQWDAITYTVRFDANGGRSSMAPQVVQALVPTALNVNAFTREGYRFDGWNTKADGTGTRVADGELVTPDADLTLYAQWKKVETKAEKKTDKKNEKKDGKAEKKAGKAEKKAAKKNSALPKTGDTASLAMAAVTALAGAGSLLAGARKRRK